MMDTNTWLPYIQNLNLGPYPTMRASSNYGTTLLSQILRKRNTLFTQWKDFIRKPQKLIHEQQICVIKGKEEFRLVSPIYRKDIYVGVFAHLPKYESPLNFFDPDYTRFPQATKNIFIPATLNAGDCMYVPAYYFV